MKKLKLDFVTHLVVGIISFLLCYVTTNSLILSIAFIVESILVSIKVVKLSKMDASKYKNINKAYNFVSYFNVEMLSTKSVYEAYKQVENYVDVDFANIPSEDLTNQLIQISSSYHMLSFDLYIRQLDLYDKNGGNFLKSEEIATDLIKKNKIYYDKLKKDKKAKLLEVTTIYFLWILVVIFLRLSLEDYYVKMLEDTTYVAIYFVLLSIGLFTYYLTLSKYLNNTIRGL